MKFFIGKMGAYNSKEMMADGAITTTVEIPWVPIFGTIISLLILIIAYFAKETHGDIKQAQKELREADKGFGDKVEKVASVFADKLKEVGDHFAIQVKEIKGTVENLTSRMGELNVTIQTEATRREGESKRVDELHKEIHEGPNCVRVRLHDLENFQTKVELRGEVEARKEKRENKT